MHRRRRRSMGENRGPPSQWAQSTIFASRAAVIGLWPIDSNYHDLSDRHRLVINDNVRHWAIGSPSSCFDRRSTDDAMRAAEHSEPGPGKGSRVKIFVGRPIRRRTCAHVLSARGCAPAIRFSPMPCLCAATCPHTWKDSRGHHPAGTITYGMF